MSKTNQSPTVRVATIEDHTDGALPRRFYQRGRKYTSATKNASKMYDQRLGAIMDRFYQSLRIDRSGGDGR
jgi:hypothetical protein